MLINNDTARATPTVPMPQEQRAHFDKNGYLLVSRLIPRQSVVDAVTALGEEARQSRGASFFRTTVANVCYTPALCALAAELGMAAPDASPPEPDSPPFYPVGGALAIITYPSPGEWIMPSPHIDHALKKDGFKVFPPPYRLASLLYLSDVAPGGGGTVVWPGSHQQIEHLAQSDPERYGLMAELNENLVAANLGEPVELTPKAGDILFYHYLLAHAGSKNTTDQPRMALNHKW